MFIIFFFFTFKADFSFFLEDLFSNRSFFNYNVSKHQKQERSSHHESLGFWLPSWCKTRRWGHISFAFSGTVVLWVCAPFPLPCGVHWLLQPPTSLTGHSPTDKCDFLQHLPKAGLNLTKSREARVGAEEEIPLPHIPSKLCKCKHRTAAELHLYSWSHTPLGGSHLQRADPRSSGGEKPTADQILHFWAGQTQLAATGVSSQRVSFIKNNFKVKFWAFYII